MAFTHHSDGFHSKKHGPEEPRYRGYRSNRMPIDERWRLPEYVVEYSDKAQRGQDVGDQRKRAQKFQVSDPGYQN